MLQSRSCKSNAKLLFEISTRCRNPTLLPRRYLSIDRVIEPPYCNGSHSEDGAKTDHVDRVWPRGSIALKGERSCQVKDCNRAFALACSFDGDQATSNSRTDLHSGSARPLKIRLRLPLPLRLRLRFAAKARKSIFSTLTKGMQSATLEFHADSHAVGWILRRG